MPEEVLGKPILEKVPGELQEKFTKMALGGVWKTNVGKSWSYCGDLISSKKVNITLVIPFQLNFAAF